MTGRGSPARAGAKRRCGTDRLAAAAKPAVVALTTWSEVESGTPALSTATRITTFPSTLPRRRSSGYRGSTQRTTRGIAAAAPAAQAAVTGHASAIATTCPASRETPVPAAGRGDAHATTKSQAVSAGTRGREPDGCNSTSEEEYRSLTR